MRPFYITKGRRGYYKISGLYMETKRRLSLNAFLTPQRALNTAEILEVQKA